MSTAMELAPAAAQAGTLTISDVVWIATALLHVEYPGQSPATKGFRTEDIVEKVKSLGLTSAAEKSIWQHVNQHCVANRKPLPNRSCMLFATGDGARRLFRPGDRRDEARNGAPDRIDWDKLPPQFNQLKPWYELEWSSAGRLPAMDPLLALRGTGRGMWDGLSPDEFVASLRAGWEAPR